MKPITNRVTIDVATEIVISDRVFTPISANLFVKSVKFSPYFFIISKDSIFVTNSDIAPFWIARDICCTISFIINMIGSNIIAMAPIRVINAESELGIFFSSFLWIGYKMYARMNAPINATM